MNTKWLISGLVIFLLSGLGWFLSVILSVITFGKFRLMANIFGIIAAASLPVSIFLAIFLKKNNS